jgi:1-acyl-sn-glycerol-3-phosphate acyltransferase
LRLVAHLFYGLGLAVLISLNRRFAQRRERIASRWHRSLLDILCIRVTVRGRPAPGQRILVANHISWLDIHILGAHEPTRFVSKAEVRDWPLAGWFADAVGTFYLKRGAGGTKQLSHELRGFVESGGLCTFFPEGTTTTGENTLRFQPRLFAVAIETGHPVQPIAFRYGRTADGRDIAPFVGDDDLLSHLLRVMREPGIEAEITYCDPIPPQGLDRSALARAAQNAVLDVIAPSRRIAEPLRDGDEEELAA